MHETFNCALFYYRLNGFLRRSVEANYFHRCKLEVVISILLPRCVVKSFAGLVLFVVLQAWQCEEEHVLLYSAPERRQSLQVVANDADHMDEKGNTIQAVIIVVVVEVVVLVVLLQLVLFGDGCSVVFGRCVPVTDIPSGGSARQPPENMHIYIYTYIYVCIIFIFRGKPVLVPWAWKQ